MGVAQGQQELDRVINIARKIKGVKEVISYVKLAGIDPDIGATEMQGNTIVAEPVPLTPTDMQNDMTSVPSTPPQDTYQGNSTTSGTSSIQSEVLPP
jgi:hypothetical protein